MQQNDTAESGLNLDTTVQMKDSPVVTDFQSHIKKRPSPVLLTLAGILILAVILVPVVYYYANYLPSQRASTQANNSLQPSMKVTTTTSPITPTTGSISNPQSNVDPNTDMTNQLNQLNTDAGTESQDYIGVQNDFKNASNEGTEQTSSSQL